ncbi:MAG: tetratricopeptide repeat protein, partial [Sphingobacterium sp.]
MIHTQRIGYKYLKPMFTGLFSVILVTGYAQQEGKEQGQNGQSINQVDTTQPSVLDSIDIVREYRPILADAVKMRRSPDMNIDREALEIELREIIASLYFTKNNFKEPYHSPLPQRYPDAARDNIDNNRIGILAYLAGQNERAVTILEKVEPTDAFYQSSLIALGRIALKAGDKQSARNDFQKASALNYDQDLKADALFNYAKILAELDSVKASLDPLQEYISMKYAELSA